MLDFIYNTLASIGFTHPLHPVTTHIPMGMAIGGFIFKLASYKWDSLSKSAYYCYFMALIFSPFAIITGLMDWQQKFGGTINNTIMVKIISVIVFIILLLFFIYLNNKIKSEKKIIFILYLLCFLNALIIGFIGGQLVFG